MEKLRLRTLPDIRRELKRLWDRYTIHRHDNLYRPNVVVWDDLRIVPGAFVFPGNSDPSLSTWQPGGAGTAFYVYEFNSSDEAFFTCQIPHGYKEGTTLYPHVHWTPRDDGAANNGNTVAWKLDYSIASTGAAFAASTTVDLTDTCTGTNHLHELTSSGTISGTGLTISSMLVGRIYRDAGDTWVGGVGNRPAILEFDIHFQLNSLGSRQEPTKW